MTKSCLQPNSTYIKIGQLYAVLFLFIKKTTIYIRNKIKYMFGGFFLEYNYDYLIHEFYEFLNNNGYDETDIAIHCDNEEKANVLISVFLRLEKAWSPTAPLFNTEENRLITRWNREKENTCYRLNENNPDFVAKSNIGFYQKRDNVEVVEFTDVFVSLKSVFPESQQSSEGKVDKKKKFGIFSGKKKDNTAEEVPKTISSQEQNAYQTNIVDVPRIPQSQAVQQPAEQKEEHQQTQPFYQQTPFDNNGTGNTSVFSFNNPTTVAGEIEEKKEDEIIENNEEPVFSPNETIEDKENDETPVDSSDKTVDLLTNNDDSTFDNQEIVYNEDFINNNVSYQNLVTQLSKPFMVQSKLFKERVFRFHDGFREELIDDDFWVRCNEEWELVYILLHMDHIIIIDKEG